jgi:hypothetical protein
MKIDVKITEVLQHAEESGAKLSRERRLERGWLWSVIVGARTPFTGVKNDESWQDGRIKRRWRSLEMIHKNPGL